MNKEIICVYQDCPFCGSRGKHLKQLIFDKNLNVRKVSFASPEGKELCHKAVFEHQIGTMPFFTDGVRFSTNIDILLTPSAKNVRKVPKNTAKNVRKKQKKGVEHGSDS